MKKGYTHIEVVLDRSGSMGSIKKDTIGGFNTFLEDQQKAEGEATLSLAQFDTTYEKVFSNLNVNSVEPLTDKTFIPRGGTALYDAICRSIDSLGTTLHDMRASSRPEKVVFVIITDGGENASREFAYADVNDKISHQRDTYNWEFVFIGANQDAMAVGSSLGISRANSITFAASAIGAQSAFGGLSKNITAYRSNLKSDMSYTAQDRAEQEKANKA